MQASKRYECPACNRSFDVVFDDEDERRTYEVLCPHPPLDARSRSTVEGPRLCAGRLNVLDLPWPSKSVPVSG